MDDKSTLRASFYIIWLATLLLQAYFVELRGDEAYYWRYSLELAWGYFDHPPVTALLVRAGYLLFQNELGVRLFFILLGTATIGIMEKLINPSNLKLYYAIVLSVAFLQIGMAFGGGMFAIPDFPLLFFMALFIFLYKYYLQNSSWWVVVLLPMVISLLLLTKYHGVLVVGFTVLSNPALLKMRSFWLIVGLSTVLFLPHLVWQYANEFPSLKYHLYERSSDGYALSFTTEYLLAQPFILGPFIGILLIYLGFVFKPDDLFERSLKFLVAGTYLFFFLMTFKGRVEGNWTVITLIPLLYIGYKHIEKSEKLKKVAFYSFAVSLLLILLIRVSLAGYLLPSHLELTKSLMAKKSIQEMKEKFGNRPVAFMNSYQRASLYQFYSGVRSLSLNNVWGRKNQYSIWDTESEFQGKSIILVANYPDSNLDSILFSKDYLPYVMIDNFRSSSNVAIDSDLSGPVKTKPSGILEISVKFNYKNSNHRDLEANHDYPSYLVYSFFQGSNSVEMRASDLLLKNDMVNNGQAYKLTIMTPAKPDVYNLFLSVGTGWLPPGINSGKVKFIVE